MVLFLPLYYINKKYYRILTNNILIATGREPALKGLHLDTLNLKMDGIYFKIDSNESISIIYEKNSLNFEEIINYLSQNNIKILDIVTEDGNLEDVFIQLTNR